MRVTLYDLLYDPVADKPSSTRVCGFLLCLGAIGFALAYPEHTASLTVLSGAMLVSLGLRKSP